MIIVSVFDSAAGCYSPPSFMQSRGVALRSFMDVVSKSDTPFNSHPEHYSLFFLGEFDQVTASFSLVDTPECIAKAWEVQAS